MDRFVGLRTVVTLLCGFEKKYEGNNEKKSQISTDSGNLEQWHLQIFFCFIFFFVDELQWVLILFVSYLSILRMFLLLNWLFSLYIKCWWVFDYTLLGVRLYPLYFEYTRRYLGYYNFLYNFQIHEWPCTWFITSSIIVSFNN